MIHLKHCAALATAFAMATFTGLAHDFESNGLFFNVLDESFAREFDLMVYPDDGSEPHYARCVEVTYDPAQYDLGKGSYSGDVVLPEKITHDGEIYYLARIGDEAFRFSDGLNTVTIPDNGYDSPSYYFIQIGDYAFADSHLTSLAGSTENLKRIGESAFSRSRIESITLYSFSHIGSYAFANSSINEAIFIGYGGEEHCSIPEGAFSGCANLKRVNGSFSSVGKHAFENCIQLTSAPASQYISEEAYSGCTALTEANFGSTHYIERRAFYNCTSLQNVEFSITSRPVEFSEDLNSFEGCSNLRELKLYQPLVTDYETFKACNPFSGCPVTKITFDGYALDFPITPSSFPDLKELISNTLVPPHIGTLSASQYSDVKVTVPKEALAAYNKSEYWRKFGNIATLDNETNYGIMEANGLYYYFSYGGARVVRNPFGFYDGEIEIPAMITDNTGTTTTVYGIDMDAFFHCRNLKKVTFAPDCKINHIGNNAFAWSGIESIDLSDFDTEDDHLSLGDLLFWDCRNLVEVKLPEGLRTIPDQMCQDCVKLTSVNFPSAIETISRYAFSGCKSLKEISIKGLSQLISIKDGAFYNCGLTAVDFPQSEGLTIDRDAFYGCPIPHINIPGCSSIGNNAFGGNDALTSFKCVNGNIFPDDMIADGAANVNLVDVTSFHANNNWFSENTHVEKLIIRGYNDRLDWNWPTWNISEIENHQSSPAGTTEFTDEQYKTITLKVPDSSLERYRSHPVWGKFLNISGVDYSGISSVKTGQLNVHGAKGYIAVETASDIITPTPYQINVYGFDGRLITITNLETSTMQIPVSAGHYVVNISGRSFKVQVR